MQKINKQTKSIKLKKKTCDKILLNNVFALVLTKIKYK